MQTFTWKHTLKHFIELTFSVASNHNPFYLLLELISTVIICGKQSLFVHALLMNGVFHTLPSVDYLTKLYWVILQSFRYQTGFDPFLAP